MLQYIFWSSVLGSDNKPVVHHGHIATSPPVDQSSCMLLCLVLFVVIPFLVIGVPIIAIWWDIKKHPNKPVKRVIKK
jgi:hypothetical protein